MKFFTKSLLIAFVLFGSTNLIAQSLSCLNNLNVSLDQNGEVVMDAEMILFGGPYDFNAMKVEPSVFYCAEIGEQTVSVTDTTSNNSCWSTVQIEDKFPPVAICDENIIIHLENPEDGIYTTETAAIDYADESWDNCTAAEELRYTFTPQDPSTNPNYNSELNTSTKISVFDENDGKYAQETNNIYIWDESNNWNSCWTTLDFVLGPCEDFDWEVDVSVPLENINISAFEVDASELSPSYLSSETDYNYNEVFPVSSVCHPDALTINWVDSITDLSDGAYIIHRTFTAINWLLSETRIYQQNITNTNTPTLVCSEMVTISLSPFGESSLNPDMFLQAGNSADDLDLNISTVYCEDIANSPLMIQVTGSIDGMDVSCNSILNVEDKTPPTPIAIQNLVLVLDQNGEAILDDEDINNGSFDGCSENVTLSLSQYYFNTDHIGNNTVILTVCDEYDNCNSTWTNVQVVNSNANLSCNDHINISLDNAGEIHLTPDMGLEGGPYDFDILTITPSFLDCDDIGMDITYTVTDTVSDNSCWGTLYVEDKLAPVVILTNNIVLSLTEGENGEAPNGKLFAETIDNGSYDNCTSQENLMFEPAFYEFDCSHLGVQVISLTVTDESGNSNEGIVEILVQAIDGSTGEITCPADIVVDCGIDLNDENIISNLLGEPSFDNDQVCNSLSYQDVNGFDENDDGDLDDVFTIDGFEISESFKFECGYGSIVRQWISNDGLGCTQHIYVKSSSLLFDGASMIDWPYSEDYFINLAINDGQASCYVPGESSSVSIESVDENQAIVSMECIDDICELPTWVEHDCELIGYNVTSDTLFFEENYCAIITTTYTVVNWCVYDELTNEGLWSYEVVSNFKDDIDPQAEASDAQIVLECEGESTLGLYILPDSGTCVNDQYYMEVFVDYFSDNSIDLEWSSWSPVDLGVASSPLWDDDDGNGIPDVRIGNIGGVDNVTENTVPNDFVYAITLPEDAPVTSGSDQHLVIWKVFDFCGNLLTTSNNFTIQGDATDDIVPIPYCVNQSTALMEEDEEGNIDLTIYAIDFDLGSYDNCTSNENLRFTFSDTPPSEDSLYQNTDRSSYLIVEYPGAGTDMITIFLDVYVWDENNNYDFCTTELRITIGDCLGFSWEEDVFFPLELIEITALGISPDSLSPDQLVQNHGYEMAEVEPTYTECWEENMFSNYTDIVFDLGNGAYKILRTWVILNWLEGETYEYTQIIKNYNEFDFICDFLPRSEEVIDCDFGHTLEDDVEWPSFLNINDHRISPAELVEFSDVDPLDSEPSFYNTPDQYVSSYVDLLGPFTPEALVILRQWTVTRMDFPTLEWEFEQTITIDLTQFSPVVSTQTVNLRPIPNVTLADGVETDEMGLVVFDESTIYNPIKADEAHNGITVKDIVLLGRHILGISELEDNQLVAADISEDAVLSSYDVVLMQKAIAGLEDVFSTEWRFTETSSGIISETTNSIQYLGIKPGDLDDDAYLMGFEKETTEHDLIVQDVVLNAGQTYEIDLTLDASFITSGVQASYLINNELVTIVDVTAPMFDNVQTNFHVNEAGELNMVVSNADFSEIELQEGETVFSLTVFANQNTTMANAIKTAENRNSYLLDENLTLIPLGSSTENVIPSSNNNIVDNGSVKVYPNPANDVLNIALSDYPEKMINIELFNVIGEKVLENSTTESIQLSHLTPGVYTYILHFENSIMAGKLQIAR